jgi:hypothetical protein
MHRMILRDIAESMRVAATKAAALYCTHCTPVLSLLIARCCDPSAKVRATAVNLVSAACMLQSVVYILTTHLPLSTEM